ncbi:C4-dicarboxylate ABC transporter [Pseudomonas sp. Bc-h]|jgi:C4-dicarboxylate transporter/malic acid transport protein|uniref:TDT family transporter n=1 Tax=Pseudomonas sp. Bc-h TaxID=1943632 RepID=UPI0009DA6587|nr:TDT family transporter [Pseudomonas sp. Bc-h]OQR28940.1 C4-dicarboxylate ABC transporter [Pseudomonas sp. Bc-h]
MTYATFTPRRPFSQLSHPREVIRQFTPNWFAATMGTGILSAVLTQLPVHIPGMFQLAEALWMLNIVMFLTFSFLYTARWVLFFDEARRVFGHSTVSMFFGTIPMGMATIINGFLTFGLSRWGDAALHLAEVLWWLDVAMSLACGVLIPFMMFTRQEHSIDQMTAVWLLPVVAAEVAAASGGLLAPHLGDSHSQFSVLITSYVLWALSVPVAFSMLTILLLRMALHKLPHASMASSSWLALGPISTGAFGLMVLGADAPAIFAANGLSGVGEIASGLGLIAGIILWGVGVWWLLMAVLITVRYLRNGLPFNLGWWGFTFPLGVFALTTLKLGAVLNLGFFSILGSVLVAGLALLWLVIMRRTLIGAYKGELFVSPCIAGLKG